ncbi:MAG: SymE family type I addiction module toxin [Bacteroidetes bacterium]|nr:SymE family type I addiction module toxin [Bacteroidota bacterium]
MKTLSKSSKNEQSSHRLSRLKVCYAYYRKARKRHPIINLEGFYLEKFGFSIGDSVELIVEPGKIMIIKVAQ